MLDSSPRFKMIELDETTSTNTFLTTYRPPTTTDITLVTAEYQSGGRGQAGNSWESERGQNLLFSLLLHPTFLPATHLFALSELIALSIRDAVLHALAAPHPPITVKWPNDIYAGDRKICGTLIENTLSEGKIAASVAGIGLNMNQRLFDPLLPNPTSLSLQTGKTYEVEKELPKLLACIFRYSDELASAYARTGFDAAYLKRLYRRGTWHFFEELPASDIPAEHRSGLRIEARILGIDRKARLLLEHRDGTLHSYGFKEIKYLL